MSRRDFPGIAEAQNRIHKARIVLQGALDGLDVQDIPLPHEEAEAYALKLRGAAVVAHASALELAVCSGFIEAAHEADTSGLLDEETNDG